MTTFKKGHFFLRQTRFCRACFCIAIFISLFSFTAHAVIVTTVFHTAELPPPGIPSDILTTQITSWADATLREETPNARNGSSENVWFSKNGERAVYDFRPLLDFIGSTTIFAELQLYNVAGGDSIDFTWKGYLLTNNWLENDVTWIDRTSAETWRYAGSDYSNQIVSGTLTCNDEEYHAMDITPAIRAYKKSSGVYQGIVFQCEAVGSAEPYYISIDNVRAAESDGFFDEAALQQPYIYAIYNDKTLADIYPAYFSIALSNDTKTTLLTWSNTVPATVLVCTNRYYSTDPADWFARSGVVTGTWADADAMDTESVYYRLVSAPRAIYTSAYDVAKFSVSVQQSDGIVKRHNWVSCPLEFIDEMGNTVPYKTFDELMVETCVSNETGFAILKDTVQSQEPIGWNTRTALRGDGNWTADNPAATNWYPHKMYLISINESHPGLEKQLHFVGRVPTNAEINVAAVRWSDGIVKRQNWVGWPYPTDTAFNDGAIASVVSNQSGFAILRDFIQSQEPIGYNTRTASRGDGAWYVDNPAATNLYAGKGYRIIILRNAVEPANHVKHTMNKGFTSI